MVAGERRRPAASSTTGADMTRASRPQLAACSGVAIAQAPYRPSVGSAPRRLDVLLSVVPRRRSWWSAGGRCAPCSWPWLDERYQGDRYFEYGVLDRA